MKKRIVGRLLTGALVISVVTGLFLPMPACAAGVEETVGMGAYPAGVLAVDGVQADFESKTDGSCGGPSGDEDPDEIKAAERPGGEEGIEKVTDDKRDKGLDVDEEDARAEDDREIRSGDDERAGGEDDRDVKDDESEGDEGNGREATGEDDKAGGEGCPEGSDEGEDADTEKEVEDADVEKEDGDMDVEEEDGDEESEGELEDGVCADGAPDEGVYENLRLNVKDLVEAFCVERGDGADPGEGGFTYVGTYEENEAVQKVLNAYFLTADTDLGHASHAEAQALIWAALEGHNSTEEYMQFIEEMSGGFRDEDAIGRMAIDAVVAPTIVPIYLWIGPGGEKYLTFEKEDETGNYLRIRFFHNQEAWCNAGVKLVAGESEVFPERSDERGVYYFDVATMTDDGYEVYAGDARVGVIYYESPEYMECESAAEYGDYPIAPVMQDVSGDSVGIGRYVYKDNWNLGFYVAACWDVKLYTNDGGKCLWSGSTFDPAIAVTGANEECVEAGKNGWAREPGKSEADWEAFNGGAALMFVFYNGYYYEGGIKPDMPGSIICNKTLENYGVCCGTIAPEVRLYAVGEGGETPGDGPGGDEPGGEPDKPGDDPDGPGEDPSKPSDDPDVPGDDPSKPSDDPDVPGDDPSKPSDDPDGPGGDPNKPSDDPSKPGDDPDGPGEDPSKPGDDPDGPGEDPSKPSDDPNGPGEDPSKPSDDPDGPGEDPSKPSDDLDGPGDDPSKPSDDPSKPGDNPDGPGGDPSKPSDDPDVPGDDPSKPSDDPDVPGDDPSKPSDDPDGPGGDPNKPSDDPSKPGDDPDGPGEDPSKPGDDPDGPGEDPSKPSDDPNGPGEDPSKPSDDPDGPGEDPSKPSDDLDGPGDDPSKPSDDPSKPGDYPDGPGDDPRKPSDDPDGPGGDPSKPGDDPSKPGDKPNKPEDNLDDKPGGQETSEIKPSEPVVPIPKPADPVKPVVPEPKPVVPVRPAEQDIKPVVPIVPKPNTVKPAETEVNPVTRVLPEFKEDRLDPVIPKVLQEKEPEVGSEDNVEVPAEDAAADDDGGGDEKDWKEDLVPRIVKGLIGSVIVVGVVAGAVVSGAANYLWMLIVWFLFRRKRIRFHGVLTEEPNRMVRVVVNDRACEELCQDIIDRSETLAEYIEAVEGCGCVTELPAGSRMRIRYSVEGCVDEDAELAADEEKMFEVLEKLEGAGNVLVEIYHAAAGIEIELRFKM